MVARAGKRRKYCHKEHRGRRCAYSPPDFVWVFCGSSVKEPTRREPPTQAEPLTPRVGKRRFVGSIPRGHPRGDNARHRGGDGLEGRENDYATGQENGR